MDFKDMTTGELLLIINFKSNKQYTHDELQAARNEYISRMYDYARESVDAVSAKKTARETTEKELSPDSGAATMPEKSEVSQDTVVFSAEFKNEPVLSSDTVVFTAKMQEELSLADSLAATAPMPEITEEVTDVTEDSASTEDINETAPYDADEDIRAMQERIALHAKQKAEKEREAIETVDFTGKLFFRFIFPLMIAKEMCILFACMVTMILNFRENVFHLITIADMAYITFISVTWYMSLNSRCKMLSKILVFTEIFRTISELFMMQTFFGTILSVIYLLILSAILYNTIYKKNLYSIS